MAKQEWAKGWDSPIVLLGNNKSKKICPRFLECIDSHWDGRYGCVFMHPIDTYWKAHHCSNVDEYIELVDLEEETTT